MTLRQKQSLFCITFATFIVRLYEVGYEVTDGEAWRTPEQAARNAKTGKGIAASLHCDRLARDINVFKAGRLLTADDTEDWATIGALWKSLHPLARHGGDFQSRDYVHFSFAHGGRA